MSLTFFSLFTILTSLVHADAYVLGLKPRQLSYSTVCSANPSSYPLSCSTSSVSDTCCTDSPGGHLLQTQFWDTGDQSTGPSDSWTIHGLWPDLCDGSYEQYCDTSRESTDVRGTIQSFGQDDLLTYMNTYWKDYQGNDETFWEHEYNKHGTCVSSLEPACFNNFQEGEDLVVFFQQTVNLFKQLPSYDWLAQAGIVPSTSTTYTLQQIQNALGAQFSGGININCKNGVFNEIWYHYSTQGGVASGNFVPAAAVGSGSTCPSSGIQYLPKYNGNGDNTTPSSSAPPSASSSPSGGNGGSSSGSKGFIYPTYSDGSTSSGTCLISDGTWYSGSCAGYTLVSASGGYNLETSKGLCGFSSLTFSCSSSVSSSSAAVFTVDGSGTLRLAGNSAFSAKSIPRGSTKQQVYSGNSQAIDFTLNFVQQ